VKVPSAEEIRKLLEERKRGANKLEVALASRDAEVGKRDEEIQALQAETARLMSELGRAKSTGRNNMAEMRGRLSELVEKYGCEPAEELLKMVMEEVPVLDERGVQRTTPDGAPITRPRLDSETRANVLLKLMEFRMPKLRSSETAGQMDVDMRVVIMRFGERVPEERRAIDVT